MIFQVLKDNKVFFWTTSKECIPDDEQIKALKKAGYKIKVKEDKK